MMDVKNQYGGLKMALMNPKECHQLDAKILLVPRHQLIVPSPLLAPATDIRTYKATMPIRSNH